jgi:hypothetical protein
MNFVAFRERRMKKLSKRMSSYISIIIFLAVCTLAIYVELESALRPMLYERFALGSPTLKDGMSNAKPLMHALKMYKAEFQQYPSSLGELPATKDVFGLTFVYKYEPDPSTEKPQEYMLSFRKRWSERNWYCFYSGNGVWLETSDPCWETRRSTGGLRMVMEYYH